MSESDAVVKDDSKEIAAEKKRLLNLRACEECGKDVDKDSLKSVGNMNYVCQACAPKVQTRYLEQLPRGTFKFNEAVDVKRLFTAFDNLVSDEVIFRLDKEGLHVRQMDPSRCAMLDVNIERANFEEFECTQPGCFVVDVGRIIKKPLKNVAYKDEQLSFTIGYGKANMVLQSSINRVFDITLLEMPEGYEVQPLPKITPTVHAKLVLEALRKVLKDMTGDHMEILASDDGLKFVEKADEMPLSVNMQKGDVNLLDIERSEATADPTRAVYATTYFKAFCEALCTSGDIVSLEFSKDMPIKLTVPMCGLRSDFSWWLAPRIESE
jgi:DNA polymerase III sliding clamp (beta) subunit (PCNA family)